MADDPRTGAFNDSPALAAAMHAVEGLPVGTEGQVLTRAFSEAVAVAVLAADPLRVLLADEARAVDLIARASFIAAGWDGSDWTSPNPELRAQQVKYGHRARAVLAELCKVAGL